MIEAIDTAAGLSALTTVPSGTSMRAIAASPPIAHGRSWQRHVRSTPAIDPLERGPRTVDRAGRLRGGAAQVEEEAVPALGQSAADLVDCVGDAVVVVEAAREPGAVGDLAQARAQDPLDVVDHPLLRGGEDLEAVALHELADALVRRAQRGDASPHVERVLVGGAAVAR